MMLCHALIITIIVYIVHGGNILFNFGVVRWTIISVQYYYDIVSREEEKRNYYKLYTVVIIYTTYNTMI